MTREQNIFLAKKLFVELVYNTAYIEGVNVTFPQTQTIIDGGIVNNVSVGDIQTVLNLRDAWKYMIDTIDTPVDLAYVCKINEYVSRNESLAWGVLRSGNVSISGTNYMPSIPEERDVTSSIESIVNQTNAVEKSIDYFCYAVRNQLFYDGNKRTSTIIANKFLIEAGEGVLTINEDIAERFNETLLHYYNTNDKKPLEVVLKECIKTIDFEPKKEEKQKENDFGIDR